MIDFQSLGLPFNIAIFGVAAAVIWFAGTRLSYYADAIAERTGLGEAVMGVLLLGGITSLPEIAVAGTASFGGNAPLAVNNLLGGFAMQVAILAVADLVIRKSALTAVIPDPMVLLQGALGILLLAILVAGIAVGDVGVLGAGAWTWGIALVFVYSIRLVAKAQDRQRWKVTDEVPRPEGEDPHSQKGKSNRQLWLMIFAAAAAIMVMGYGLSKTSEAIAQQTGLGSSFFGAVFTAISTSLPEVSTVLAAVRIGRYVMASSDIFGTNLFDAAIIVVADLAYPGGPVLSEVGTFSIVAGLLGIVVTGVYMVGLIERRDPALFGVGLDSYVVMACYVGGLALLYTLR